MKEKIIVKRNDEVIYKGGLLNLPIKEDHIIQKSIDVFGDDEPCIIHQSFVVKELVSDLLEIFKEENTIRGADYLEELNFLNYKDIATISLELVRKK